MAKAKIKVYKSKLVTIKSSKVVKSKTKVKQVNHTHQKALNRIIMPNGQLNKRANQILHNRYDEIADIETIKAKARRMVREMQAGKRRKKAYTVEDFERIFNNSKLDNFVEAMNINLDDLVDEINMSDPNIDIDESWVHDQDHWQWKSLTATTGNGFLTLPNGERVKLYYMYQSGYTWAKDWGEY